MGLPNCGECAVRRALDGLTEQNFRRFQFYMLHLADAIVNPFPLAEEPHVVLDSTALRLALEAEQVPLDEWASMIEAMRVLHKARWDS